MRALLGNMQCISYSKGELIFDRLQEVEQVVFVEKSEVDGEVIGHTDVGFEVNGKKKFVLRLFQSTVLGGVQCMNHTMTLYIYRACRDGFKGFCVRKSKWIELMTDFEDVSQHVRNEVETHFTREIL
jgi:hypothetical protein